MLMKFLTLFLSLVALYFLPYLNAWSNGHKDRTAILVVNLFLGWTFIGWIIALSWSFKRS